MATAVLVGCGHKPPPQAIEPTAPLPTAGIAGQQVILLPLTLVAAQDSLHWDAALADHHATLARADSTVGMLLQTRVPEVTWVLPSELRRVARRAPGIATDPDQMGTALLRFRSLVIVPDPLRNQLRTLAALAGGGSLALVPADLIYKRTPGRPTDGTAELTLVLVDVRTGHVGWRTVARGEGNDPWTALTRAVKGLSPGLP
jgi:hypothetical protein